MAYLALTLYTLLVLQLISGQEDQPFGASLKYDTLASCTELLDVVRPYPGVYPYSFNSPLYREGSTFGQRYFEPYLIQSPLISFAKPILASDNIDQGADPTFQVSSSVATGIAVPGVQIPISGQVRTQQAEQVPEFSETNNQIEGIDEADIVKTDGKRIYAVGGRTLLIYNAFANPAQPKPQELGRINLNQYLDKGGYIPLPAGADVGISNTDSRLSYGGSKTFAASDILIEGNNILVIGQARQITPVIYPYYEYYLGWTVPVRTMNTVLVLLLDATNPAKPSLKAFHEVEGTYVTGRKTGGVGYLVLGQAPFLDRPQSFDLEASIQDGEEIDSSSILPVYRSSSSAKFKPITTCTSVGFIPGLFFQSLLTVAGINLGTGAWVGSKSVLGPWSAGSPAVVAYADAMYVGLSWRAQQPWYARFTGFTSVFFPSFISARGTVLLAFNLNAGAVSFRSMGQAPGRLLNQYSMDEYDGYLRVAITTDGFNGPTTNAVHVYNKNTMNQVGKVTNLAPGEQIYAARFIEDRAYIVTFRQVDPLFVIGLDDPINPKVLGELKIPGFSDYIHPAGPNKLLGFGKGGTDQGTITSLKVALFDVTNPAAPKEQGVLEVGGPRSGSEILDDPKALLYKAEGNAAWFVLPVELASNQDNCLFGSQLDAFKDKPRTDAYLGAYLVKLDLGATNSKVFEVVHEISHETAANNLGNQCYRYCNAAVVKRALFVGDVLYTLSDQQIKATDLSAALDGKKPPPVWESPLFKTVYQLPSNVASSCSVYP